MQTAIKSHACVTVLILLASVSPAGAKYSGGTGTRTDPYQIATAADLILLGDSHDDYRRHFALTADIDLDPNLPGRKVFTKAVIAPDVNDANWEWDGSSFSGTFNGRGRTISHLTITGRSYLGLFGRLVPGTEVKDLVLADVRITGSGDYIGGLVARNVRGMVTRCHISGSVTGDSFIGGLVGFNEGCVAASSSSGTISGNEPVGGLVGTNEGGITRCYSTAAVTGHIEAGGLAGNNGGSIVACYSTGPVTAEWLAGGLVGSVYYRGSIVASCSTGAVSGVHEVGGLAGSVANGSIGQCYSTGFVSGSDRVGGLVGTRMAEDNAVVNCVWDMQASGQDISVGGVGKTTAEMQTPATFLDAGWDCVEESRNGTCDYWLTIPGGYPRLRYLTAGDKPVMPEGRGTDEQPYLIRNARDLGVIWTEPAAHYRLDTTLDLSGIVWSAPVVPWLGESFDGVARTISGLYIQGGGPLGFFGQTAPDVAVSWLYLDAAQVHGTGLCIGGLVGISRGVVAGCRGNGVVTGAGREVGGLVGQNAGRILDSFTAGVVQGHADVGGLVGYNDHDARIERCRNAGAVNGNARVGGLVGTAYGSIDSSHSTGAVSGAAAVGGLLGAGQDLESITRCYSTCAVAGDHSDVGGLAGYIDIGDVLQCYSIGAVQGSDRVGGLVGYIEAGTVSQCYSAGVVGGRSNVGGLVGVGDYLTATDSVWDAQVSGRTTSAGGTGRTTAEMQTAATFLALGWDFVGETANGSEDVWRIDEGKDYPRLGLEPTPEN